MNTKHLSAHRGPSMIQHANWWHQGDAPGISEAAAFRFTVELLIRKGIMTRADVGSAYRKPDAPPEAQQEG